MFDTSEPPTKPNALRHLFGFSNFWGICVYENMPADCWSRTVAMSVEPMRFHAEFQGALVLEISMMIPITVKQK
jgi:hypothetical protein